MSSTGRADVRIDQDKYDTPIYTVNSLMNVLDMNKFNNGIFLEPCRSVGNIYNHIYNEVYAGKRLWAEIDEGVDYLSNTFRADFAITNPPFSLALEFLEKMLHEVKSVFCLLRLNFLGSQKRYEFWNTNPPTHVLVLSKRPSFTGKGTDSIEYAWFCWDRHSAVILPPGVHVLPPLGDE